MCQPHQRANPCAGSSAGGGPEDRFVIDGPLAGLTYKTSSGLQGVTDVNGAYSYHEGDTVEFLLGTASIGAAVAAADVVTPLTVCGATALDTTPEGTHASNLIRLFLALDTGSNPYGLTLPDHLETSLPTADIGALLKSNSFSTDAKAVVEAAKQLPPGTSVIPDATEADAHWQISQKLAQEVQQATDDTLILTVKVPDGYVGKSLAFSYHAETIPTGVTSYQSGQVHTMVAADQGIVTFRGKLHSSHWQLTLSLVQSQDKVVAGDLLSFYHAEGFGQALPQGYPLDLTAGRRVLQADLSSGAAIKITTVQQVSGFLIVPKALPDGTTDWSTLSNLTTSFSIFNSIQNGGSGVGMLAVNLPLGASTGWTSDAVDDPSTSATDLVPVWKIPFLTTLPGGYAYMLQSYLRTTSPGGYQSFSWAEVPTLKAALLGVTLQTFSWSTPSS